MTKSCTLLCGHNSSLQTKIAKLRTIQLFVLPLQIDRYRHQVLKIR